MFYMVYRSYSVLNSTIQDTQILRRSEFFNGILSEMRKNIINMKQVLSKKNYQSTKLKEFSFFRVKTQKMLLLIVLQT